VLDVDGSERVSVVEVLINSVCLWVGAWWREGVSTCRVYGC